MNDWDAPIGYSFSEYQRDAMRTAANADDMHHRLAVCALGLTGEAGEVADIIKKIVGHGHPLDAKRREELKKELGDVLWYIANLCDTLGITMPSAAWTNIQKLKARYPDGFSTERSMNRKDEP